MRQNDDHARRETLAHDPVLVDFHDFIRLAPLLFDTELAETLAVDARAAAVLRARLDRN